MGSQHSVAIGYNQPTQGGVAIGSSAMATGVNAVAIGDKAVATGKGSIAIGIGATAAYPEVPFDIGDTVELRDNPDAVFEVIDINRGFSPTVTVEVVASESPFGLQEGNSVSVTPNMLRKLSPLEAIARVAGERRKTTGDLT